MQSFLIISLYLGKGSSIAELKKNKLSHRKESGQGENEQRCKYQHAGFTGLHRAFSACCCRRIAGGCLFLRCRGRVCRCRRDRCGRNRAAQLEIVNQMSRQ